MQNFVPSNINHRIEKIINMINRVLHYYCVQSHVLALLLVHTLQPHMSIWVNHATLDISFGRWPTVGSTIKTGILFHVAMAYRS